jgi:phenylacetate-coenzyme A ligase PaaK-like adenylate-forming protein
MIIAERSLVDPAGRLLERLRRVVDIHFDPERGSPYWLERQAMLGVDVRRACRDLESLEILGTMTPGDLTGRPLRDFVPRAFHDDLSGFIVGQTGGTTGVDVWTIYRPDEFTEAFITPFAVAAAHVGFPRAERWLYVGPGGPHVIGKVVRDLSASLGGHEPFSVDFDARWAKRLADGSFARERYVAHVIEQAVRIIETQEVGVLFTTPAVLGALSGAMTASQRARIRGVHYGGMEVSASALSEFRTRHYPNAVHLSGYGNTLFGCCLELDVSGDRTPEYFPFGSRLIIEVVDDQGQPARGGEVGTVRMTRLDESFLIVRMLERDRGVAAAVPRDAPIGFLRDGVRAPHSPVSRDIRAGESLY